jgi:lysophospholipase L1-like esterase
MLALLAAGSVSASSTPIGNGLFQILDAGAADVSIVVAGDSTGDEDDEWVYLLALDLARRYPGYRVEYYLWNKRSGWPSTPREIQPGAPGTHAINIWNMSVSGTTEDYALNYAERSIVPIQPDLLLISYGHNDGTDTERFRWGIQSLVQTVAAGSPRTEIGLIAQNPETGNTYQQARAAELALLAEQLDLAFVDVLGAFEATGNPDAYLRDGIHPTPGASYLWEQTVFASMGAGAGKPGPVRMVGAVTRPVSLIRFGDFSRFVKGQPAGWTLKNTKATVDFQAAESPHRYAVRFTDQTQGAAYLYQPFNIKLVRGRWVTVAVRLYVPPAPSSPTIGLVGLLDNRNDASATTQLGNGDDPRGLYYWQIVSRKIDPTATSAGVAVYVDSNPDQTPGSMSTIYVQQVMAVLGPEAPLVADTSTPGPRDQPSD